MLGAIAWKTVTYHFNFSSLMSKFSKVEDAKKKSMSYPSTCSLTNWYNLLKRKKIKYFRSAHTIHYFKSIMLETPRLYFWKNELGGAIDIRTGSNIFVIRPSFTGITVQECSSKLKHVKPYLWTVQQINWAAIETRFVGVGWVRMAGWGLSSGRNPELLTLTWVLALWEW
jgi:hypothetical protein